MRFLLSAFYTGVAAGMVALASPSIVEAQGCPWCTTPTKCEYINESAASECTLGSGGCSTWGICVLVMNGEPKTEQERSFRSLGISNVRTIVTEEWGEIDFAEVAPNLYAMWNCQGEVLAVAAESGGQFTRLDPAEYRDGFSIANLTSTAATQ